MSRIKVCFRLSTLDVTKMAKDKETNLFQITFSLTNNKDIISDYSKIVLHNKLFNVAYHSGVEKTGLFFLFYSSN